MMLPRVHLLSCDRNLFLIDVLKQMLNCSNKSLAWLMAEVLDEASSREEAVAVLYAHAWKHCLNLYVPSVGLSDQKIELEQLSVGDLVSNGHLLIPTEVFNDFSHR